MNDRDLETPGYGNGKFPKAGIIVSCQMDQRESPVRPSALLGDGREKV